MKKQILAIVISSVAAFSHAATANWGVGAYNIYNGDGDESVKITSGTTVYMFDAKILTQTALFDAFANNTSMDFTQEAGYAASVKTTAAGVLSQTQSAAQFTYGDMSSTEQINTYSFFFAIVNDNKIYLSDSIEKSAGQTQTAVTIGFANQDNSKITTDGFVSVGQWSQVSGGEAPEPTTCSLLLVGLAGMGLKRLRSRRRQQA